MIPRKQFYIKLFLFNTVILVSCPSGSDKSTRLDGDRALCVSRDAIEDLVRGPSPDEGFRVLVVHADVLTDVGRGQVGGEGSYRADLRSPTKNRWCSGGPAEEIIEKWLRDRVSGSVPKTGASGYLVASGAMSRPPQWK